MSNIINRTKEYIIYSLFYCLSLIPLVLLYPLYLIIAIINHFFKYRIDILHKNIKIVFPQKKKRETLALIGKFYHNLYIIIIEVIKSINFNKQDIKKRVKLINEHEIHNMVKTDKSIILIAAHYANWEWLLLRISLLKNKNVIAVYQPLSNKYLNSILLKIRTKFNAKLVPLSQWNNFILKSRHKSYIYFLVSDQNPNNYNKGTQISFFNKKTLFHNGPEKMHKLLNAQVFYTHMKKIQNGYYELELKKINPHNITEHYVSLLEKTIINRPENWLWSHNRWKK
jgi:KDO2-lipid IV(A) lauroyltransferase